MREKILTDPVCPIRCSITARILLPSCENSTLFTAVGNSQVNRHCPVCTFHNFIVLSAEPVASKVESAGYQHTILKEIRLTWTVQTAPTWPSYVPNRSPLCEYHTLTTRSFDVEKRRSPSGLYTTCVSDRSWPWRRMGRWRLERYQRKGTHHCVVMEEAIEKI